MIVIIHGFYIINKKIKLIFYSESCDGYGDSHCLTCNSTKHRIYSSGYCNCDNYFYN